MPELPEVQTTVNGLTEHIVGLTIADVWSDYGNAYWRGSETIKDERYFRSFRRRVIGKKVSSISRRGKNIRIHLRGSTSTILVHMRMTGHLLYGTYSFDPKKKKDPWTPLSPPALMDPFNRHVHFVISFSNGKCLALSDVRKFATVSLIDLSDSQDSKHFEHIGPEPLGDDFDFDRFVSRLNLKKSGKVKQVLMDQSIIAGIGNIYADESLWRAGIHPLSKVSSIPPLHLRQLLKAIQETLTRGIDFGGDSTSDYRNVQGERGEFHEKHRAYQRTGEHCGKKGCSGIIRRIVLAGRGTHYCDTHQKLFCRSNSFRHKKG